MQDNNERVFQELQSAYAILKEKQVELDAARDSICDVCFTSSFQPCAETEPNAVKDPQGEGYMCCGYCQMHEQFVAARQERDRLGAVLEWIREKARVYVDYGGEESNWRFGMHQIQHAAYHAVTGTPICETDALPAELFACDARAPATKEG